MSVPVSSIKIDLLRDAYLSEPAMAMLRNRYMVETESSPQEAFARAAAYGSDSVEMAQKIYDYASNLWFMFATPILANGGTDRGFAISCFLNHVGDSRKGITEHWAENTWLSSMGGGIGANWSSVRSNGASTSKGSKSTGIIPFLKVVDSQMLAISQGSTRRGGYAAYLNISHPEIEEFIKMRKPTGGDHNRKCLNMHHAVVIPDSFMEIIERCMHDENASSDWDLIDPNDNTVKKTICAKTLWQEILEVRSQTGEPFMLFLDTVRRDRPEIYKALGLEVTQSNLCTEITLATSEKRTAVCVLSSINAEKYDGWSQDPDFIPLLVRFLDNIIDKFTEKASKVEGFEKAVYSVKRERSIGIGLMGFHALLQKKRIPIDGPIAIGMNHRIFSHIKEQATQATKSLAAERGPCLDAKDAGFDNIRNTHLLAIAPNASSSIICGWTSPSIEPYRSNTYTQKILDGSYFFKNPYLKELLAEKGKDDTETWNTILSAGGSVQGLDCLSTFEKEIFKTATEIHQKALVDLAGARQQYLCQAQSLNIFLEPDASYRELHEVHFRGWKKGVETFYYLRSDTVRKGEDISKKVEVKEMETYASADECTMCEG